MPVGSSRPSMVGFPEIHMTMHIRTRIIVILLSLAVLAVVAFIWSQPFGGQV